MSRARSVTRALAVCAAAACASATGTPAASAAPAVKADPGLHPSFRAGTPDYTVRCDTTRPVRFTVHAPEGTRVAVDGRDTRGGSFHASVALAEGQGTTLRFVSAKRRRTYGVRCLPSDFPRFTVSRPGHPQVGWFMLTPNDFRPDPRYVTVVDSHGVPVWWMRSKPGPFDVHLLPSGNLAWAPFAANTPGAGPYQVFSLSGRKLRTYQTVGWTTNQHDLQVQPDGSAYAITYRPREHVDLSRWGGPSDAIVLDGEIQHVDRDGNLLWRWSSKDHLRISETGRWLDIVIKKNKPIPLPDGRPSYDLVHLNSVQPLGKRLVFSARYEDAVYEIDRTSGRILWKLGGRKTSKSLKIEGDPLASKELGGNHDARVLDGGRIVTVFDNGTHRGRPPRALAFRIDRARRTATLVTEIGFAPARDSVCCGSARVLPGGDWVIGWGHTPWITEQTPAGKTVLSLELHPDTWSSYRAEPVLPGQLSRAALRRGMDAIYGG